MAYDFVVFLKSKKLESKNYNISIFYDQRILHFFVSLQFDPATTQHGKSALKGLILNRQTEYIIWATQVLCEGGGNSHDVGRNKLNPKISNCVKYRFINKQIALDYFVKQKLRCKVFMIFSP